MEIPSSGLDPAVQQQIEAFNQALLHQAKEQFQRLQLDLIARRSESVTAWATELPKPKSRQRSELAAALQRALTSTSHWLSERWSALEADETEELPLPDGKDVIVIDANYTVITPERKDTNYGLTHTLEHSERARTAQKPDQSNRPAHSAGDARGSTPATGCGECGSNDSHPCATGN